MKKSKYFIILGLIVLSVFSSCKQSYHPGKNIDVVSEPTMDVSEIDALLRFIENSGDYINSTAFPALVTASDVYENLGKYYVIDIRPHEEYVEGHISGAVNVRSNELIKFLEDVVAPTVYEKLVVVCHNGQESAYVAGVMRLTGYSNAYSMSFGMSAWNKSLDNWSSKISSDFINQLETKTNPIEGQHPYPALATGANCGAEILDARAWTLLNTPFQKLKISAERAFKEHNDFYIIAYMPKDIYEVGHIPGAYNYIPQQDIKKSTLMNTIPSDKKVLVYDFTGQTSAFIAAYLRMLGYNAFTMPMGANSFMYNILKQNNRNAFVASEKVNDFPLTEGENPTDKSFEKEINPSKSAKSASPKISRSGKKEVSGGCS